MGSSIIIIIHDDDNNDDDDDDDDDKRFTGVDITRTLGSRGSNRRPFTGLAGFQAGNDSRAAPRFPRSHRSPVWQDSRPEMIPDPPRDFPGVKIRADSTKVLRAGL